MKASTRKVVAVVVIGAVLVMAVVIWSARPETRTSRFAVQLNGKPSEVTVKWDLPWSISIGPQYLARFGHDTYTTTIETQGKPSVRFVTDREPKAIWQLQGSFYLACFSPKDEWLVLKRNENGEALPVPPNELPSGEKPWNLVPQDRASEWQSDFDHWATSRT